MRHERKNDKYILFASPYNKTVGGFACQGDSGNALFIKHGKRHYQIGNNNLKYLLQFFPQTCFLSGVAHGQGYGRRMLKWPNPDYCKDEKVADIFVSVASYYEKIWDIIEKAGDPDGRECMA